MITVASLSGETLLHVHEDIEADTRYPTVSDLIGHISSGTFGIRPGPQQVYLIRNDDTRPLAHHEIISGGTTVTYVIKKYNDYDLLEAERLLSAASRGLNTIVANILDILVDPNTTVNSCTALHMALGPQARIGDIQLIELITLLMDSHSDPNILDCMGSSPLSLAIRTRILESTRYDIVDELCKGRADVNARDGSTYTSLHMAAYYGRLAMAEGNTEQSLADQFANILYSHRRDGDTSGHRRMCAASSAVTKMNDTIQCSGHRRGYVLLQAILRSALRPITSYQHTQIVASPVADAGNPYAPHSSLFRQACLLPPRDLRLWMQQLTDLQRLLNTLEQYVQSNEDPTAVQWVRDTAAQVEDDYLLLHFSPNVTNATQDGQRLLFPPVYDEADEHRSCP
eukprot:Skav234198  [mRNA]  locus=scaffold218:58965:60952:+ [translate_table: standard]